MKAKELIEKLQKVKSETEVKIAFMDETGNQNALNVSKADLAFCYSDCYCSFDKDKDEEIEYEEVFMIDFYRGDLT